MCKNGGKIIIPTYVNNENDGKPSVFIRLLEKFGAGFKKQFDFTTYMLFFEKLGYKNVEYSLVKLRERCLVQLQY